MLTFETIGDVVHRAPNELSIPKSFNIDSKTYSSSFPSMNNADAGPTDIYGQSGRDKPTFVKSDFYDVGEEELTIVSEQNVERYKEIRRVLAQRLQPPRWPVRNR